MHRPGILLALLSAVLFGASTPLAKLLLGAAAPGMVAGLLYLGAGGGLLMLHLARTALRRPAAEAPLRWADAPRLALVVLTGGVLGPLLLMLGLAHTPAAAASLLLNLEGLVTMAIAWVVFRENVDARLLLGAGAILAGAVLLSWQGAAAFGWGGVLIAGACVCWGIDNNLTRTLSAADPVGIAMLKGLAAGTVNLVLALAVGAALPGPTTVLGAGVVGFLGYGVSLVLFMLGLRHLGTARAGAYFSLAPFIGALLAVALLHDPVTLRLIAAAGLMGVGLWLHLAERHEHDHAHEALEHAHRHVHDDHHQHAHHPDDPAASHIRIGIGTRRWCIGIRITRICTTGTGIRRRRDWPRLGAKISKARALPLTRQRYRVGCQSVGVDAPGLGLWRGLCQRVCDQAVSNGFWVRMTACAMTSSLRARAVRTTL